MKQITATQIAQKLDISRSYLYYLRDKGIFNVASNSSGRLNWNVEIIDIINDYIKSNKPTEEEVLPYKTTKINNRRYLGNKYKLLGFIKRVINEECKNVHTIADIFAGTGAVASAFSDKKLVVNDIMYSNYICHFAWFGSQEYSEEKIIEHIIFYNSIDINENNYMTDNFSNTFFSKDDCSKIGYIREDIEKLYKNGEINERERALLITSLLYGMDKIANTCGHYDAYRKNVDFDKTLELYVPIPEKDICDNNQIFNIDANVLAKKIEVDLVYIDPPYNSRQYCDAYHLLENVAKWEKPEVLGVARKMDRTKIKSDYCTTQATKAFEELIESINSKYILLSYNNMASKGNDRSNAKISDKDIFRILENKGSVKVFSESYKAFTAGKSDIKENQERLFLCECFNYKKDIIQSPLNYTGGKYRLLPQILPLFPKNIDLFVDLFCGGCNVGINSESSKVLFNDSNATLLAIYNTFMKLNKDEIFDTIYKIIHKYGLSLSSKFGYRFYECDSSNGLAKYNKENYLKLRNEFNEYRSKDNYYFIMLYVLIIYSFNNQMRFNKKGNFNLPVGKRDFNNKMASKLSKFIDRIKSSNYMFVSDDFMNFDMSQISESSFIYADPPYLITCATYNEQGGWTEKKEKELYRFLDEINNRNIKFALSNVLESKGITNNILLDWINRNKAQYKVIDLVQNYSNSNYQIKNKKAKAREVLIINY